MTPTRLRLSILAFVALGCFLPSSVHAAVAEICNKGDATLNVATAIYSQSILFGNSYHLLGWYHVQPNNCETIYSSVDPDDVYVGFTYRDPKNLLHAYISEPRDESGAIKTVSEKFCVNVEQAFDYKIATRGSTNCQAGFAPLEFSIYFGLSKGDAGRVTYTMRPDRLDPTNPVFGSAPASSTARMLLGGDVQLVGQTWQLSDGSPVIINSQRNLPTLAPKQQHSTASAPVNGYVKQIADTLAGVQSCYDNSLYTNVSAQRFSMDDRGVAVIANRFSDELHVAGYGNIAAMAIGDMDFGNASVIDRGGCWELNVECKDRSACGQKNETPAAVLTSMWQAYLDNKEKANAVLNALKAIAPYYPDATPEIHH